MINLGVYNTLTVLRSTSVGLFLGDDEGNDVLLPLKYIPENTEVDDEIEVYIYKDSEDRIIATNLNPKIKVGEFKVLKAEMVTDHGAFLDMGLEKQLFVPFKEQGKKMAEGVSYMVTMFVDEKTDRLVGSSRLKRHISNEELTVEEGQSVKVKIWNLTDLGYNVIVDDKHIGLIYENEIFEEVWPGDTFDGYVHAIREDNKLDIKLGKKGYSNIEPNADKIMLKLQLGGGKLALNDKSDPDDIKESLGMSKKTFKKALGLLYKNRMIEIEEKGIKLV
ncbi:MAG: putative RNA-binding protein (virulence factor B family) [Sphingobacteriales bacterium]|jgi:predicted RNA-binding protein (virulence factor B family)